MRGVALWICLVSALAMYKDEAGKYDWALTNLGQITFADYLLVKDRPRFLVKSVRGVLATLKMNGQVDWRKLPYGLDADFQVLSTPGCTSYLDIITFAPDLSIVATWDLEDGMLLWSQQIKEVRDLQVKQTTQSTNICVLTNSTLLVLSLSSGKEVGKVELDGVYEQIVKLERVDTLAVVRSAPILKIAIIDVVKGSLGAVFEGRILDPEVYITDSGLVSKNSTTAEWLVDSKLLISPWKYQSVKHVFPLSNALIDTSGFILSTTSLKLLSSAPRFDYVVTTSDPSPVVLLHKNTLTYISLDGSGQKQQEVELGNDFTVAQLWLFKGVKSTDLLLCRGNDDTLLLFDQGKVKWQRDEALGHATGALFVDLPGETLHAHNEYFIALSERHGFSSLPGLFFTRLTSQIASISDKILKPQAESLHMDNFGFNKLLLVTTKIGKVLAIHSMTGTTVWTKHFPGCRIQHTVALDLEEVVLVTECGEISNLVTVSVLTGRTLEDQVLKTQVIQVLEVEENGDKALVLVGADLSLLIYPPGPMTKQIVERHPVFFYIVNRLNHSVTGYRISSSLTCDLVWNMQLPPHEDIRAFKTTFSGHIQQPAIATGLSKLLFKYIDTNMFVIATMKVKSGLRDGEMTIYVVNAVSGRVVTKVKQEGVSGKIVLDCDENWVVAHYWNGKNGRYEFLSIEMYEQKVRDSALEMIIGYLENSQSEVFSSYSRPAPVVLHQSYASTTGFQSISHTMTMQGITRQDLLLIMNTGQLLTIDRRLLSPRRKPEEDTELSDYDDAALPPYKPLLPIVHTNVLSHDRLVEGLQHTTVSWTLLESTCFVAAYGLDLFAARVMPEKVVVM